MRRVFSLSAFLALLGVWAFPGSAQAQEQTIIGAWITTAWEGQEADPQPGMLIFTETHYSMMFVPAGMIREEYTGEEMTDAEMLAAFQTLVANSGRYTRSGDEITTEAYVALNPNYMARWGENQLTYTFQIEGDLLHLTWPAGFARADAPPFTGTFRKVE
jgi:hypothetical protein